MGQQVKEFLDHLALSNDLWQHFQKWNKLSLQVGSDLVPLILPNSLHDGQFGLTQEEVHRYLHLGR